MMGYLAGEILGLSSLRFRRLAQQRREQIRDAGLVLLLLPDRVELDVAAEDAPVAFYGHLLRLVAL